MKIEPPSRLAEIDPNGDYIEINEILYAYCAERDNCLCLICGKRGDDLHHVTYRSQGGKHSPNNLATLCKNHHMLVHAGTLGDRVANILHRKIKFNDIKFRRNLT